MEEKPEYFGFIHKERSEKLNIRIEDLSIPDDIWNLPPDVGIVCYVGCPEFEKLESDQSYKKIKLRGI